MKPPSLLALALTFTLTPNQSPAQQQLPSMQGDSAAIANLIEHVEAANNAGDVDRWVSFFAPDFVYMAPGAPPVTTRPELVEVAKAGFRHRASLDIAPDEIRVLGDWAFARSTVTGTVRLARSGNVVPVDVKQIVIYRRMLDGSWRIARLINNSNTP